MRSINYLGFLSLLSIIAVLGWSTGNTGLYGFLGFLYYARYFFVVPDELFRLNVQKAAFFALIAELLCLIPFLFVCSMIYGIRSALPMAFALCFAAAVISFSIGLAVLEWKEQKGAAE